MALAIILIVLAGMTWLAIVDPRSALLTAIFLVPWSGLDVDVGLRISAHQLALAPLCLVTLLRATQSGWTPPRLAFGGVLLALALHACIWSLLQIGMIPIDATEGGALRGPTLRAVVQIAMFLFTLSPAILVGILLRGEADIRQTLRIYLASLVVLAIIGWIQIGFWYGTGRNPLPLGAVSAAIGGNESAIREGQFLFESLNIYRMNSFCTEPRNLATALVLGMLIIQAIALATRNVPTWRLAALWVFFLLSTLATFSTSGALIWTAGTASMLPLMWMTGTRVQRRTSTIVAGLLVILLPLTIGVVAAEASGIPVIDLLAERTLDRIDSDGALEDFDLAITDYLRAEPVSIVTGVGLGNIHLYATPYLDPLFALYAEGRVFVGKTGIIRTISELGLIGFLLFAGWFFALVASARRVLKGDRSLAAIVPIALVTFIAFILTNQVTSEVWIIGGLLAVLIRNRAPLPGATPRLVPA